MKIGESWGWICWLNGLLGTSDAHTQAWLEHSPLQSIYGQQIDVKSGSDYIDLTNLSPGFYLLKVVDVYGNYGDLRIEKN